MKIGYGEFVCGGLRKPTNIDLTDASSCAYDATPPSAVYVKNSLESNEKDSIKHAFSALSNKFGKYGDLVDVFELFGEFESGHHDVLFSDNARALITDDSVNELSESYFNFDGDDEVMYKNIQCRESGDPGLMSEIQ